MKSGFKTTEFFGFLIVAITTLAVHAGLIGPDEAKTVNDAGQVTVTETSQAVLAIVAFVKVVSPIVSAIALAIYTWSRTKLKLGG